jgi:dTDP-4-dehydrorhamnose 3,5-epimerase-like enzyme
MIRVIESYFEHADPRGCIKGIINEGDWKEMNFITSDPDIVRGNHYHKEASELFFILKGEVRVRTQRVDGGKLAGEPSERIVREGDIFIVDPMTNHTFYVLKDSAWINALTKKMDNDKPDTYRV